MDTFIRNAACTAQSKTLPFFLVSNVVLTMSYYLYKHYDVAAISDHYAFLYHILVSPLVFLPFALSINERNRFEQLGYTFRWNAEAVRFTTGYCLLTSVVWAYVRTYLLPDYGAFAAAANVGMGWMILMGVSLVPLWCLARRAKREDKKSAGST